MDGCAKRVSGEISVFLGLILACLHIVRVSRCSLFLLKFKRDTKADRRSFSFFGIHMDRTAVRVNNALGDIEAKSATEACLRIG